MNPGDLIVLYERNWDGPSSNIDDVGIILEGSWSHGKYKILFSKGEIRWINRSASTIRRISIR